MVQETSLLAYAEVIENLGERQRLILLAIDKISPCNNTQIAEYLKIPINSVTPRVWELRKKKMVKLNKIDECPRTHRQSMFWERIKK